MSAIQACVSMSCRLSTDYTVSCEFMQPIPTFLRSPERAIRFSMRCEPLSNVSTLSSAGFNGMCETLLIFHLSLRGEQELLVNRDDIVAKVGKAPPSSAPSSSLALLSPPPLCDSSRSPMRLLLKLERAVIVPSERERASAASCNCVQRLLEYFDGGLLFCP